jgi:biotin carboxylase
MIFVVGRLSKDFRTYFAEHSIDYGMFVPPHSKDLGKPNVYEIDFSDQQSIEHDLATVPPLDVSGLLVCGYEHFVLPAAIIAQQYHVPGMSIEAATAATDKIAMREHFKQYAPAITPDFAPVTTWDDIVEFMSHHHYPVMLKPANLMKSLYVTKNESLAELRDAYDELIAVLPDAYRNFGLRQPRILIEEHMVGSMHTVAGFVDNDGNATLLDGAVDCVTASQIGKHDNYLFSRDLPSQLQPQTIAAIHVATQKGVAALGLRNTPIHAELMLTAAGAQIIEIGARLGGYRPRMYEYGYGIDMYQAAIDTALGARLQLSVQQNRTCSVLELFGENEGTLHEITGAQAVAQLPSYLYHRTAPYGKTTGRAAAGYRAPFIAILGHEDASQVAKDRLWIEQNIIPQVV